MINFNFHQHSNFSDGLAPPEDYVKKAIELNYSAIGFSEHAPLPFNSNFSLKEENIDRYINTIDGLSDQYSDKINVYRALETDYIPSISNDFKHWSDRCKTDYVIGSVHLVKTGYDNNLWFIDGSKQEVYDAGLKKYFNNDVKKAVTTYYHQVNQMIVTQEFDVVGHIDKIKMHNQNRFFSEDEPWYQNLIDECLELVKQKGLIVEVNTRGIYKKRFDGLFPDGIVLQKINNLGIPVIISTDAHQPNELNLKVDFATQRLIDYGFNEVSFFEKDKWIVKKL